MKKTALTLEGTNDILFSECEFKHQIEENIMKCFKGYGYFPLETPLMEYDSVFFGNSDAEGLYRLVDRNGAVVSLRPDMTMPIARVTATKLYDQLPVRASYLGNVYRFSDPTKGGRQNEFTQAGIELLGEKGTFYDAEVIALTVNALLDAGATDFMVELGNVNFVRGLLSESHLSEELQDEINDLMVKKDILSMEEILQTVTLDESIKDIILKLPTLFGGKEVITEMLTKKLPEQSKQAICDLLEIYTYLSYYGYENYITFDLGMNKNMDYYTGMIFKIFHQGVGFPVAGGGRYDKLISRFGKEIPATGSAIYINRLTDGMSHAISHEAPKADEILENGDKKAMIAKAKELRKSGKSVIVNG